MTDRAGNPPVTLDRLRSQGALESLTLVASGEQDRVVQQVVLAESLEKLSRLAPDSLILLTGDAAAGGWALAAALRTAWERRATAVVAPESTCGPAAALLAEHLDLALFSTSSSAFDLALVLAVEVGGPAALRDRRIARAASVLADQRSVVAIVKTLNDELDVPIALTAAGQLIAGDTAAVASDAGQLLVSVSVPGPDGTPWAKLVAPVHRHDKDAAAEVDAVFRLARAPIAAILARARLSSARKIQRDQVAFRRLRSSVASGAVADPTVLGELSDVADGDPNQRVSDPGDRAWHPHGDVVGVYLTDLSLPDEPPGIDVTTMLLDVWSAKLQAAPLVVGEDGWISWFDARLETSAKDVAKRLKNLFAAEAGGRGLAIGIGTRLSGAAGLVASVDQARLAARAGSSGAVSRFDQVGVGTVLASLRASEIMSIGQVALPDLFGARDSDQLIQTLLAVLDCGGSLGQAAERLGIHRNTVLARVGRARELGAGIDDPNTRFAMHALCYAVAARLGSEPESG